MKTRTQHRHLGLVGSAALATLVVVGVAAPSSFATFAAEGTSNGNSATAGDLTVTVNGLQSAPAFVTIVNAVPEMSPRTYTLDVTNTGSVAASLTVISRNIGSTTPTSLDDVLSVTIKDSGNATVYAGKISAIDFDLASLAAGATSSYSVAITWPDNPPATDNLYQDAQVSFDIAAQVTSIAGQ
ncbi:MAG: hypothetical protein RL338_136 [Chloroflexota bacterium]|jgi:hypothetical protein